MTSFTPLTKNTTAHTGGTKHTTAFTPLTKNSTSYSGGTKSVVASFLDSILLEDGGHVLMENAFNLLLEQITYVTTPYTALARSTTTYTALTKH